MNVTRWELRDFGSHRDRLRCLAHFQSNVDPQLLVQQHIDALLLVLLEPGR